MNGLWYRRPGATVMHLADVGRSNVYGNTAVLFRVECGRDITIVRNAAGLAEPHPYVLAAEHSSLRPCRWCVRSLARRVDYLHQILEDARGQLGGVS